MTKLLGIIRLSSHTIVKTLKQGFEKPKKWGNFRIGVMKKTGEKSEDVLKSFLMKLKKKKKKFFNIFLKNVKTLNRNIQNYRKKII